METSQALSPEEFKDRKIKFEELLGKDCEFIDVLIINTHITYWDIKKLTDKNCPPELIKEILL